MRFFFCCCCPGSCYTYSSTVLHESKLQQHLKQQYSTVHSPIRSCKPSLLNHLAKHPCPARSVSYARYLHKLPGYIYVMILRSAAQYGTGASIFLDVTKRPFRPSAWFAFSRADIFRSLSPSPDARINRLTRFSVRVSIVDGRHLSLYFIYRRASTSLSIFGDALNLSACTGRLSVCVFAFERHFRRRALAQPNHFRERQRARATREIAGQ